MTDISSSPLHKPGARVLIVNDRATVRYVGTVAGQEGRWAGVEWDDASRGKHDGMTGGVRYFGPTASGPTACSFVRIEKVDFGLSVLEALHLRYTNQRGELGEVAADEMYVHTVRQRKVQIEVVGIEKIKALQSMTNKLVTARLVNAHISHVVGARCHAGLARLTPHGCTLHAVPHIMHAMHLPCMRLIARNCMHAG